mmetsp:Transcript_45777/g.130659  ORF Transcript_45777/g.130659 Transcript_45777/m.130659 type:complete len:339 (+) Transcript_45777:631-1647(+)
MHIAHVALCQPGGAHEAKAISADVNKSTDFDDSLNGAGILLPHPQARKGDPVWLQLDVRNWASVLRGVLVPGYCHGAVVVHLLHHGAVPLVVLPPGVHVVAGAELRGAGTRCGVPVRGRQPAPRDEVGFLPRCGEPALPQQLLQLLHRHAPEGRGAGVARGSLCGLRGLRGKLLIGGGRGGGTGQPLDQHRLLAGGWQATGGQHGPELRDLQGAVVLLAFNALFDSRGLGVCSSCSRRRLRGGLGCWLGRRRSRRPSCCLLACWSRCRHRGWLRRTLGRCRAVWCWRRLWCSSRSPLLPYLLGPLHCFLALSGSLCPLCRPVRIHFLFLGLKLDPRPP